MSSEQNSSRWLHVPWRLAGAAVLFIFIALLWWSGTRESPLDKEITRRLAELRASGEPIDAQDLARLFPNPPPSEDAGELLTNILVFALDHPPPASTPIIMSRPLPPRTEALAEPMAGQLRAYCKETKTIFEQTTPWPTNMRFALHWERGMMSNTIPQFMKVRSLTHMLTALAMGAAEDGDLQGAADMLERGFRFTQTIPSDLLVGHMIRQACAGLTVMAAERCLNRVSFTDAQLARLAAALPPPGTYNLATALRGEHCLTIWAFQAIKSGRRFDDIVSSPAQRREPWWKSALRKIIPRRNEYSDRDFATYLSFCRPSLEALALPPAQAVTNFSALMTAYATNVTSEIGQGVPANWPKTLLTHYEIEAKLDALSSAFAVERYRLAHDGKLPSSLKELVPAYLRETPRDLFDNQPLRFKPLPFGYVIYSLGADGVDDGGLEKTGTATKYDVTITVER